jgi:short-subunit dehydrogenase
MILPVIDLFEVFRFQGECRIVAGDICEPSTFNRLCDVAIEVGVDVLVNNAGLVSIDLLEEADEERIEKMVNLNLLVPIKLTRRLLPKFKENQNGTIVNINSSAGRKPAAKHVVYTATKHGMRGFSDALKEEIKGLGIRILDISPGKMATDLFNADGKTLDMSNFMPPREIAEITIRLLQMSEKCSPSEFAVERTH